MTQRVALCVLLLSVIACEARRPPIEPPEVQLAPTPVNKAPQRFRPTGAAVPGAAVPSAPDPRAATALAGVLAVANEMRDAAREAEADEADLCTRAFLATSAAARVGEAAHEAGRLPRPPPKLTIAPRARYLVLCASLPEDAKRCASFSHRVGDTLGCERTRDALTPPSGAPSTRWRAKSVAEPIGDPTDSAKGITNESCFPSWL